MTLQPAGMLLLGSTIASLLLCFHAWKRRQNPAASALARLLAAVTLWSLFYGLSLSSPDLADKKALLVPAYLGVAASPVLWLMFAARYSGSVRRRSPLAVALFFTVPAISVIMLATNDMHHLFYSSVSLGMSGTQSFLTYRPGFFWWQHIVYSNLMVAMGLALLIRMFLWNTSPSRARVAFIIAGALLPYISHLAFILGYKPFGFLDLTPVAFMGTGLVFYIGIMTVKLFDITPFAMDVLFENLPDAVFVLDRRSRLLSSNPGAKTLLASSAFSVSAEGVMSVHTVPASEFFTDGSDKGDIVLGNNVFSASRTTLVTPGGKHIGTLVVLHDITERRKAQETISRHVELQKLISVASSEFIRETPALTDAVIQRALNSIGSFVGADRAYVFLFRNNSARMEKTHEWCAESIQPLDPGSRDMPECPLPWWIERFVEGRIINVPSVSELPEQAACEKEILQRQGVKSLMVIPMVLEGSLVGFLGFDAIRAERVWTEVEMDSLNLLGSMIIHAIMRGRAEDALQQSESLARTVIDNSRTGISVRSPTGQLLLYNKAWENLWGMTEERIRHDMRPREMLAFDERDSYFHRFHEDVRRVFTRGGDFFISEMQTNSRHPITGQRRIISQHFNGITNNEGVVERVVILTTDITDRVLAEEERGILQEQLYQAQKMDSVGRLAGGVAHDFNNMLGAILGHAEFALERVERDHPLASDLEEIKKAAERSADLTRQLLAFARKQTIAPKVLDLNQTVDGMLRMLRRLIGENIELVWNPASGLGPVRMDPSQIDQILTNLCVNARDAVGESGRITIETGAVTFDEVFCSAHPGSIPGEYALLSVGDNGCGMDTAMLSHLFEPFFTTKEQGKGTGLGLATVYGIVKQNKGYIEVRSEPGKGSTFRVCLPRHGTTPPPPARSRTLTTVHGHETVLVVEDEGAILDVTRIMLERLGYSVLTADSPEQAIALAGRYDGQVHMLITDVVMPGMNGAVLAGRLSELFPGIRCLFMSGYTADAIANEGVLNEGVNFIQKPFSGTELARMVRVTLDSGNEPS